MSRAELLALWESQLTDAERASLRQLAKFPGNDFKQKKSIAVSEAVAWAEEHLFDRNSVVRECQIWQEALGRARGEDFSVAQIKEFTQHRSCIRTDERPGDVTLREVLLREWEIVQTVKDGVGDAWPLVANPQPFNSKLDDEQRAALDALLSSINLVSIFRGGAGTGKSFVLRELVEQLQQADRRVVTLAPQRQQIVELERAGFPSPSTVASFVLKRELAERAVVVVDEAGQIGGRQMHELIRLVRERNGRLILSGDTRQHGAVEASDALLAIERHAGIKPVELQKIRRQDPSRGKTNNERDQIKQYRNAVESAASGKMGESFERLNRLGAVVECGLGNQTEKLAEEYVRLAEQDASAVVVSQTWSEVHRVNSSVRDSLKTKGLLGADDTAVQVLEKIDLTNTQKRDERFYPADAVSVFNQKVGDAQSGTKGKLAGILKSNVLVEVGGKFVTVSNKVLNRVTVYQPREIFIARGVRLWDRLHGHLLRFGQRAADTFCRLKLARRRHLNHNQKHEHKIT